MEFSAESKVVPEPSGTYTYLRDGARVESHLGAEQDPGSAGEPSVGHRPHLESPPRREHNPNSQMQRHGRMKHRPRRLTDRDENGCGEDCAGSEIESISGSNSPRFHEDNRHPSERSERKL